MKLSDFLRWGQKKSSGDDASDAARDRRHAPRRLTGGAGWVYWAAPSGESRRVRVSFVDVAEDSSGLGFIVASPPAVGSVCWALPDGGKATPCAIRHVDKAEKGFRVGASLTFTSRFVDGRGSSRLQWVDEKDTILSIPATVKNSGNGLVEVNLPANIPARHMVFLEGPQYGCLAVSRGARPDGQRFIVVAEAVSHSFLTAEGVAA